MSGRGGWFLALRWLLVAGSLTVATILLLRKDYAFGLLLAALAGIRVSYLVSVSVRRRRYRQGSDAGQTYGRNPGDIRQILRQMAQPAFKMAAMAIGLDAVQMREAFGDGQSISELALAKGVAIEHVVSAIVSDAMSKVDDYVANGTLTQQQAMQVKSRLPRWANRLVNLHRKDIERFRN